MQSSFIKKSFLVVLLTFSFFSVAHNVKAITLSPVRFELGGDPGQTLEGQMILSNSEKSPITLYSSFSNFEARGETGTPAYVEPISGIGTWLNTETSVLLAPGQTRVVSYTLKIPKDAEPGGHFGVIFWGTQPPIVAGGQQVSIGAKTGILVLLTVHGAVTESGALLSYDTKDSIRFYTSLPVNFFYRFQNEGSDRIKPDGTIKIKNILGFTSATLNANPVEGNILPKGIRRYDITWSKNSGSPISALKPDSFFSTVAEEWRQFGFGRYTGELSLSYGTKNDTVVQELSFWVFPWHLLIVLLIAFIALVAVFKFAIHHYNKWVIGQAEALLKKEMQNGSEKK